MDKSIFKVSRMDCAAEENLVRLQLSSIVTVKSLDFDLPNRKVAVYHEGQLEEIEGAINQLNLGASLVETNPTDNHAPEAPQQRRLLWTVLLINFTFFVLEITTGFISRSMGLVADSLDMLADALVYSLSLLAVGASVVRKKNVARLSGYFQITLAVLGFIEVLRRFFGVEALPDFRIMIVVSVLALIANGVCLYLLQRSKDKEAHMQASMIFTSNDVIINLGVIVAGVLVLWLDSGVPDLVIGAVVFVVVSLGAVRILRLAR
jgi:Co/Zn/Cd efflux system component/copper chaperone CopZ